MFTNAHNVYFNKEFFNFIIENSNKTYTSTTNDINKDEYIGCYNKSKQRSIGSVTRSLR